MKLQKKRNAVLEKICLACLRPAMHAWTLIGMLVLCLPHAAQAQAPQLDANLGEQVVMVPKKGTLFNLELETTIYKPQGAGPFPLVVINHGKSYGDPRFQNRWRHGPVARFFLQRGYAVILPMRQGFSKSTGTYIGGGCNIESNGRVQAEDVRAVLDWAGSQSWADKSNILMMGQSHGGWTTLAFGTLAYPGVKALVNFAGGLRQESCAGWEGALGRAAGNYGQETKLPSLWFYGDNDSFFAPYTFKPMHEKYTAAGGKAQLVAFGTFGQDAHSMFGSSAGQPIWQPKVLALMESVGLPVAITHEQYAPAALTPIPPKTDFAALNDETKLPNVRDLGRDGYKLFLTKQMPRAFALSPSGAWAWANMGDDPLKRALDTCNRHDKGVCKLYAVDDQVVWQP